MLRLRKRKHNGKPRVLPWRRTFNHRIKCTLDGHRTDTYQGFRSHYYRVHRPRVPLVSRYAERPQNRHNGEPRPGLLRGLADDLPEFLRSLAEAKEAFLPKERPPESGW